MVVVNILVIAMLISIVAENFQFFFTFPSQIWDRKDH